MQCTRQHDSCSVDGVQYHAVYAGLCIIMRVLHDCQYVQLGTTVLRDANYLQHDLLAASTTQACHFVAPHYLEHEVSHSGEVASLISGHALSQA